MPSDAKKKINKIDDFGDDFVQGVLAIMLRKKDAGSRIANMLEAKWLHDDWSADVAEVAVKHIRKYGTPPTKMVLRRECGDEVVDSQAFKSLMKRDLNDAGYILENIGMFCHRRAVKEAVLRGSTAFESGSDVSVITRELEHALAVGRPMADLGDPYELHEKRAIGYLLNRQGNYIGTGFSHVDGNIFGIERGEVCIAMGPSNCGKSQVLKEIAFNNVSGTAGRNVLYVTCEMSKAKVEKRFDKRVLGPAASLLDTRDDKLVKMLKRRAKMIITGRLRVVAYPSQVCTVTHLNDVMRRLRNQEDFSPDVVVIDYLDEMSPVFRTTETRENSTSVVREVRRFAAEQQVAVFTATQTTRSSYNKDIIDMADVADDINRVRVADVVLAICRTREEEAEQKMRLYVAKMRDGERGAVFSFSTDYGGSGAIRSLGRVERQFQAEDREHRREKVKAKREDLKEESSKYKSGKYQKGE